MKSRTLYRYLLRLHPRRFRERFGADMLWLFDETVGKRGAASLVKDAVFSLVRRWCLRSGSGQPQGSELGDAALENGRIVSVAGLNRTRGWTPQKHFVLVILAYLAGAAAVEVIISVPVPPGKAAAVAVCLGAAAYILFRRYERRLSAKALAAPVAQSGLSYREQLEDSLRDLRSFRYARSLVPLHLLFSGLFRRVFDRDLQEIYWGLLIAELLFAGIWLVSVSRLDSCATQALQRAMRETSEMDVSDGKAGR